MTDKAQRLVLWILALTLVGGTALALRYARGYRPLAGLGGGGPLLPADVGIRFDGIEAVGRGGGRRSWTLKAGRMETTPARSHVRFSGGIEASLLPDKDRPAATLTAAAAVYDDVRRALELSGSIVCRLRDLRITTENVHWDAGSHIVHAPGRVHAVHPRGEVSGEALKVDIRSREYTLRNIRAEFLVDPSEELPL